MLQVIILIISIMLIYLFFRHKYLKFTNKILNNIDNFINGKYEKDNINKETLDSKIDSKLYKLSEVIKGKTENSNRTKLEVEQMISDITHQVKTPISNIRMYSDTIINNDLPKDKENEFLNIISNQVDKLEFLMNSLTKMSRLETNMIVLNKECSKIMDCIENAKQQVETLAENKNIEIIITGENNPLYKSIIIRDNGKGIKESEIKNIFKRFYSTNSSKNSIGIGLNMAKLIIERQNGMIEVTSEEGKYTTFRIIFPKKNY